MQKLNLFPQWRKKSLGQDHQFRWNSRCVNCYSFDRYAWQLLLNLYGTQMTYSILHCTTSHSAIASMNWKRKINSWQSSILLILCLCSYVITYELSSSNRSWEWGIWHLINLLSILNNLVHLYMQVPMFTASGLRVRFLKVSILTYWPSHFYMHNLIRHGLIKFSVCAGVGEEWVQHRWVGSLYYKSRIIWS